MSTGITIGSDGFFKDGKLFTEKETKDWIAEHPHSIKHLKNPSQELVDIALASNPNVACLIAG